MQRRHLLLLFAAVPAGVALGREAGSPAPVSGPSAPGLPSTAAGWRARLTPAQFDVLREAGTEMPFSSPLDAETRAGTYACAGCGTNLYSSATKYDSGTGWPSFWEPLPHAVATRSDSSLFMDRTEVHCATCAGHLGHVFNDGPRPTGLRYCMNGVALAFHPAHGSAA